MVEWVRKQLKTQFCGGHPDKQERLYMNGGSVIVSTNPASWIHRVKYPGVMYYDNRTAMRDSDGRYMLSYGNQYLDSSKDRVYSHLAVIEDYVASCITFISPSRVPAGKHHHVSMPNIEIIVKMNYNEYTETFLSYSLACT